MIAGAATAILSVPAREARLTSFVVDFNDVLHLAWQSSEPAGVWYSRCKLGGADVAGRIRQVENWTRAERVDDPETSSQLGDLVLDREGRLWIGYSRSVKVPGGQVYRFRSDGTLASNICPTDAGEIWLAGVDPDGKWKRTRLTDPGPYHSPVMDLDDSGNLHLVFGFDVYLHYLRLPAWPPGDRVDLPDAVWTMTPPASYSVLGWGTRALVAFEKAGHVVLYAVFDGNKWSRHALYDTPTEPCHQPILARDHHGVAWLFWVNGRRGYTFFARWLGTRFSTPYESRALPGDPFSHGEPVTGPPLGETHTVERNGAPGSGSLGVALSSREASSQVYFDRVTVPDLIAKPGRRVLFLDMLEVAAVDGLAESFNAMTKHPANPVVRPGPPGAFDDLRAHAYGEVLRDDGQFRMWYSALSAAERDKPPQETRHYVGYAESRDGIRWVKPILNQVEYRGSTANNILDLNYQGKNAHSPMLVKDGLETDSAKRYKMILYQPGGNTLQVSPDGIRWRTLGVVNPSRLPGGERNLAAFGDRRNLFFDSLETHPERRWKVFSHCSWQAALDGRRMTCRYWSPDLFRWFADPRNPVMDPRGGEEVEQHLTSVWPSDDLYLGMFDSWDVLQRQAQHLIVSRDGINFVHVFPHRPVIELGKPGAWDAGWIAPTNVPVQVGDELWYYYSGCAQWIGPWGSFLASPMATGLATIRRDGFVSLSAEKGRSSGSITSIPLQPGAGEVSLEVSADRLGAGRGRIVAEVVKDNTILARSQPVMQDGHHLPVSWTPNGTGSVALEPGVRLRFRLEGSARLYSFAFK